MTLVSVVHLVISWNLDTILRDMDGFELPSVHNAIQEFLKATVDLADLVGIHIVMTKVAGKGETKFLVAGLGWASAELLMTRFVPLWVGARGMEFDWHYVQISFDSNISLVSS